MRLVLWCALILVAGGCESETLRQTCGIRCGPAGECPTDYACRLDGRCYLAGAPIDQSCLVDSGVDGADVAPTVVTMFPPPDESGVSEDVTISVVFSEPVTGVFEDTFRLASGPFHVPVSADVQYDEVLHSATLRPSRPLRQGTVYQVVISGGITDGSLMPIAPVAWSFTTADDLTPPEVSSVFPMDGAANVDTTSLIVVGFTEEVAGLTELSFYLEDDLGARVPAELGLIGETTFSIRSADPLRPYTPYTIHLTEAITDFAGHALVGAPLTYGFRTGIDRIAPTIIARTPGIGDVDMPTGIAISVRFSEPMLGASPTSLVLERLGSPVPGTVTYFPATRVARLVPAAPLEPFAIYAVRVRPGLTDVAGNPCAAGDITWTFRTGS